MFIFLYSYFYLVCSFTIYVLLVFMCFLFICFFVYYFICLFICLFVCSFICLFVCSFTHLYINLFIISFISCRRLVKSSLNSWKLFIVELKEERKKEKRKNELRKRVREWLPDFGAESWNFWLGTIPLIISNSDKLMRWTVSYLFLFIFRSAVICCNILNLLGIFIWISFVWFNHSKLDRNSCGLCMRL